MRKATLAVLMLLLLVQSAFAQGLQKIADNVYAYAGSKEFTPQKSFAANAGVVVTKDGVIVVDTLMSAKEGKRLLTDIRKITPKPVKYVVLTHTHLDHAFGASVFTEKGAILVSHELDRESLAKNGEANLKRMASYGLTKDDLAGTRIVLPSLTFTERLTIRLGGEVVELIHQQPSHSPGSTLVLMPRQKVLFAGDILFTDTHPYMGEGDITGWAKTLDYIETLDLAAIIPGHGPVSTKKDVADMKDYLLAFDAKARELAPAAASPEALAAEMKKLLPARSQGEGLILYSLKMKYLPQK